VLLLLVGLRMFRFGRVSLRSVKVGFGFVWLLLVRLEDFSYAWLVLVTFG